MLAQSDLFLPSGEEIYLFTEANNEAAAVKELLDRGVGDIVIKRGNQGASHFNRRGRTDVAPLPADEVDPTGAGDCFGGAFVSFWLAGASPETAPSLRQCRRRQCGHQGRADGGAAAREELDALLGQSEGMIT